MSFLTAPLGFTQIFYFQDYWRPDYFYKPIFGVIGFEDILFSFLIGGITAVIYEEIFDKHHAKRHLKSHMWWMLSFCLLSMAFMGIGSVILHINFMHLSILFALLVGICIIIFRSRGVLYWF